MRPLVCSMRRITSASSGASLPFCSSAHADSRIADKGDASRWAARSIPFESGAGGDGGGGVRLRFLLPRPEGPLGMVTTGS